MFKFQIPFKIPKLEIIQSGNKSSESEDLKGLIPHIDDNYSFQEDVTNAVLAGLIFNKKVFIHGLHGSGKSTHVEQICAKLSWPCVRINLDSNISRTELVGRDIISIKNEKQIVEFKEGIIPFAVARPICLLLDEYDAAHPETLFIIQKLLESNGTFFLLEENRQIIPHKYFRIIATSNTMGSGDNLGIYIGTNTINYAQLDRWEIVTECKYISQKGEQDIVEKKYGSEFKKINKNTKINIAKSITQLAELSRNAFANGDIFSPISTRTVLSFCENYIIFQKIDTAFKFAFYNRCPEHQRRLLDELFQRCFGTNLNENTK